MVTPRVVTVIGAGVMGRGIATVATARGFDVRLTDANTEQLKSARGRIEQDLTTGVEAGKFDSVRAARGLEHLTLSQDLRSACRDAELVIEAVVEQLSVKHDVLSAAERVALPDAVLATNTSALSITEIAAGLDSPERCVGMHFFNPVPKMRLCELIRALQTSDSTLTKARRAAQSMGKDVVVINDIPGFATSRLNALIGNEGMRMLEEGVGSPEDVDRAVRLGLNHPMGPLEMGDLVGWDTRLEILDYLSRTLGERYRPTNLQRRLVAAGRYGRKSGQGVYRYDEHGRRTSEASDLGGGSA